MKKFKLFLAVLLTAQLIAQTALVAASQGEKKQIQIDESLESEWKKALKNQDSQKLQALLAKLNKDQKFELLQKQDAYGLTPLHLAIKEGNTDTVEALFKDLTREQKFNLLTMQDIYGYLPLNKASGNVNVVKALLKDLTQKQKFDLLQMTTDKFSATPLHEAAYSGNENVVEALLAACPEDKKFELLQMKNHGETPLDLAARRGHTEIVKVLIEAMVQGATRAFTVRDRAQDVFREIKSYYDNAISKGSNNIALLNLFKKALSDLFGYIIYDHQISEDKKDELKSDFVTLLDKTANVKNVPKDLQDFYMILTEKKYKVDDLSDDKNNAKDEGYYATPWGLHVELTTQRLNKTAFKDTFATRNKREQFKNLHDAATNPDSKFAKLSDI